MILTTWNTIIIENNIKNELHDIKFEVQYVNFEWEESFTVNTFYDIYIKEMDIHYTEYFSVRKFIMPDDLLSYINNTIIYLTWVTDLKWSATFSLDELTKFVDNMLVLYIKK